MAVSLKHLFQSAKVDGPDVTLVQPSNWNAEHVLTQATDRLLGRTTAGTGPTEEISVDSNLSLSGGILGLANSVSLDGLTVGTAQYPATGPLSNRNKIINGGFGIWQRGTSFTPNAVIFGADRFAAFKSTGASAGDYARSTDVPAGQGFTYSGYFNGADVRHSVELPGAGLRGEFVTGSVWTLSFWAKAGAAGTGTANIGWANGVAASSLDYWGADQSYSYSTSWEKFTLTFTVSGAPTGSQLAALVYFNAVPGLYLTGIQLEAGTVATPFEHRSYGQELALCQKYAFPINASRGIYGIANGPVSVFHRFALPNMRAAPTVSILVPGSATITNDFTVNPTAATVTVILTEADTNMARVMLDGFTGLTGGAPYGGGGLGTAVLLFSAEL